MKHILCAIVLFIACPYINAGNLTSDFLAGKELNIIDNTEWHQALSKKITQMLFMF